MPHAYLAVMLRNVQGSPATCLFFVHCGVCLRCSTQAKAKSGEPREAAKAARIAALPVIEALCKAFPMGASKRVMAGLNYLWPWGHTALDLGKREPVLMWQTSLVIMN